METGNITNPMRKVLAELELLSHGSTTAWDSAGGHSKPDSRPPGHLHDEPAHLLYRRLWLRAWTEEQRAEVLQEAQDALTAAQITPKRVDSATRIGRLEIGLDERPARKVAKRFNVTERHVYRCRAEVRLALGSELERVRGRMAA